MLVGSLNPCPCGYYGSNIKECICTEREKKRYLSKLSGPLLDRIDLFTFVPSLKYNQLEENSSKAVEPSSAIRERVIKAREIQKKRFEKEKIYCNAQMNQRLISKYCTLSNDCKKLLELVYNQYCFSNRAYSRIIKLARTICDLNGRDNIEEIDIIEALQYRKFVDENIV